MLLTSLPNIWMTKRIDKYGYRGVYSWKINSFKSLASYLGTRFRTIHTYYYRCSNNTQVAVLTS